MRENLKIIKANGYWDIGQVWAILLESAENESLQKVWMRFIKGEVENLACMEYGPISLASAIFLPEI